jgi:hypothetical protein
MYARDRSEARRLDGRRAAYQFDTERDLPWHELSRPGGHMPVEFLAEAGFSVPALDPDLASLVDWVFALSTCETFIALEQVILEFAERERAALPESRSIALLRDEEIKHIQMFERYAEHLRACRPREDRELFERVFAPERALLRHLEDPARYPNLATCHYVFWLNTVFVEEYTIYFADRLDREPGIQPMWRALHAAHRREESQHVVTDAHFLESLQLDDAGLREQSQLFALNLLRFFDTAIGLGAVLAVLAAVHPGGALRRRDRISASALFQAILGHRHFKRTRRFAPYLVESV